MFVFHTFGIVYMRLFVHFFRTPTVAYPNSRNILCVRLLFPGIVGTSVTKWDVMARSPLEAVVPISMCRSYSRDLLA